MFLYIKIQFYTKFLLSLTNLLHIKTIYEYTEEEKKKEKDIYKCSYFLILIIKGKNL